MMWTWQMAGVLFCAALAITAVIIALRAWQAERANASCLERRFEELEQQVSALLDGSLGVARCLDEVEAEMQGISHRQEQLQQRDLGNLPYNEAVRLASQGAGVAALIEQCGLSRTEAELVTLLNKQSPPVLDSEHEVNRPDPDHE